MNDFLPLQPIIDYGLDGLVGLLNRQPDNIDYERLEARMYRPNLGERAVFRILEVTNILPLPDLLKFVLALPPCLTVYAGFYAGRGLHQRVFRPIGNTAARLIGSMRG